MTSPVGAAHPTPPHCPAPSGLESSSIPFPGRCPGLSCHAPSGLMIKGFAQSLVRFCLSGQRPGLSQPRATPWVTEEQMTSPVGATHPTPPHCPAPLGLESSSIPYPGRCPGLSCHAPSGLMMKGFAQSLVRFCLSGQRPGLSQPRATPWVSEEQMTSPVGATHPTPPHCPAPSRLMMKGFASLRLCEPLSLTPPPRRAGASFSPPAAGRRRPWSPALRGFRCRSRRHVHG